MIDADPQPSLSSYYSIQDLKPCGLSEVLKSPDRALECISKTKFGDLIVSNDSKNQLQNYLLSESDGRFRLKFAIDKLKGDYDYIIIEWIRLISAQLPIDEHRCLSSQKTPDKVF